MVDVVVAPLRTREGGMAPGLVEVVVAGLQADAATAGLAAFGTAEAEAESGAICVKAAATIVTMRI
jgi:hypothetical protein